ncbi:MAG: DUF2808 domain-containing protein [Moorea sp. SIO2B7]|nr:DUF2808 domain-containing protein [Moorena sp. SIO2B7]
MSISRLMIPVGIAGILAIASIPTQAVQFANGTVSFDKSPRLINAVTTYSSLRVWAAKYYFTLNLPENAGEPLGKLIIHQRQGEEYIRFQLEKTVAFEGTHRKKGERLTLQAVTGDEETDAITVIFDPPIPPGKTFTVGLKPRRNPRYGGVYLFGVTAFPVGEKPYGLYLGVGRLHFYDEYDRLWGR